MIAAWNTANYPDQNFDLQFMPGVVIEVGDLTTKPKGLKT